MKDTRDGFQALGLYKSPDSRALTSSPLCLLLCPSSPPYTLDSNYIDNTPPLGHSLPFSNVFRCPSLSFLHFGNPEHNSIFKTSVLCPELAC